VSFLARPLNYGAFSSFAPSQDSTFSGLSQDEEELVLATYGDDNAVQYADR
jgi:bromodomain-containing protein 7/9